jgi:uncharacterized protein involved in exopolysaccharide biosynthesis/Mrp family chromosome partitioning ATPase
MSAASSSSQLEEASDRELDLPALGATLWRKRWRIILPTVLVGLLTLLAVQMVTPKYSSQSRIYIEGGDNIFLRPEADRDPGDRTVDQEAVTSQAQIILSRDLALEVINKLKLDELPEFDSTLRGISPLKTVLGMLGLVKDPLRMTPEERVLTAFYDRLTVTPVEKSRIINIDFMSEDPDLAARVANAIAEAYLVRQREAKQEQAKSASEWLAGQIDTMRQKVEEAEGKVEDFRAKTNLLVGINNTTLSAQQLGDVNAQLAAARSLKADAEARARVIRDMLRSGQPMEASDILNSDLIRRLSEQRITLRAQLAEQSSTLLDRHPRIKELRAQIADLDQQIRSEAEGIARSFENNAKLASVRVDEQLAVLGQLKTQVSSNTSQDVQLRALERDAKSQRDLLESYLAKYREATSRDTINSAPAGARIVSTATVSNIPAYPKKLPTVLIATFATLLLSSGLIMTRAILAAPVGFVPVRGGIGALLPERFTPRPPAGIDERRGEPRVVDGVPGRSVMDVVYTMRRAGAERGQIAVFSTQPGQSSTQTAIKLARAFAEESRVVLVGLASGDTGLRGISSDPAAAGLAELAEGRVSFGEIITKDKLSPLHLIGAGHGTGDRRDLLAQPGMALRFVALARSYDYVIIDGGAAGGRELERLAEIAPQAVVAADTVTGTAATAARARLEAAGFQAISVLGAFDGVREPAAAA